MDVVSVKIEALTQLVDVRLKTLEQALIDHRIQTQAAMTEQRRIYASDTLRTQTSEQQIRDDLNQIKQTLAAGVSPDELHRRLSALESAIAVQRTIMAALGTIVVVLIAQGSGWINLIVTFINGHGK